MRHFLVINVGGANHVLVASLSLLDPVVPMARNKLYQFYSAKSP